MTKADSHAVFDEVLHSQGVLAALQFLNQRVPHRYTAVYHLHGEILHLRYLAQKEDAANPAFLRDVPLRDSYCQFVFRDGVFQVEDSAGDLRLAGHLYQGIVVSYHAVTLFDGNGELYGSLSHLDTEARVLPDGELEFMQYAATSIGKVVRDATV